DDGRVLHGAGVFESALDARDGRALLADRDVDAANLLVRIAGLPVGLLVDDRVDGDGRLTGLTVTDDQLALASADRDHGIDGLDSGLHRLVHRLALHDAGRLELEFAAALGGDVAESVDRVAERVDDATEVGVPDGYGQDLTRAGDLHALDDAAELAEHDDTDLVLIEVLRESQRAIAEADELVGHDTGKSLNVGDAVRGIHDLADLGLRGLRGVVRLDELSERVTDLVRANRYLCHFFPLPLRECVPEFWIFLESPLGDRLLCCDS